MTLREMVVTLAYAAWWALGGWAFGAGVQALFGVDVVLVCALGNVIIGLLFLLPVVGVLVKRKSQQLGSTVDWRITVFVRDA